MNVFKVFQERSRFFYVSLFLLSAFNSVVYSGILIFINQVISGTPLPVFPEYDWLIFIILIGASLVCGKVFQTYMVHITNNMLHGYELSIIQKLRFASLQDFEKIGAQRVYTAIGDTRVLGQVPEYFVTGINSFVIVLCGLVYLFWISAIAGAGVLGVMIILLIFYVLRNRQIEKDMNTTRDLQNDYYNYLRDFLLGFKELKMSISRNESMYNDFIKKNRENSKLLSIKTSVKYVDNELIGNYTWYILLGVIIFGFSGMFGVNNSQTVIFIVTILYLMGPVANLILFVPFYTRLKIALERINELEEDVNAHENEKLQFGDQTEINREFNHLEFNDIVFEYRNEETDRTFKLGPINLKINNGEVTFITGGNGSGKSTFVNILTGLYKPTGGKIYLNGSPITEENISYYRNQMSAIFTNNHLFSENYDGFELNNLNKDLQHHIEVMKLTDVIKFIEDKNHIDKNLSKGQQKRLALIYALMEDKKIVVLDEWAAEQDPDFRRYFYEEIIPLLKQQGKTVIAVTHDDFYFNCSDRLIKLDYGQIVLDKIIEKKPEVLKPELNL